MVASIIILLVIVGGGIYLGLKKTEAPTEPTPGTGEDTNLPLDTSTSPNTTTNPTSINPASNTPSNTNSMPNTNPSNARVLPNFTPVASVATLQKIDLVVGTGEAVAAGATVSVHYTGAIAATGVIFQSSKDFGDEPITFPLSGVISGWTEGIPGMKIGGTRRLVIPAAKAYGAYPPAGSGIPANADLVFDVELVAIN